MAGLETRYLGLLIGALGLSIMRLGSDLMPLMHDAAPAAAVQQHTLAHEGDMAACLLDRAAIVCRGAKTVSTESWAARAGAEMSEI